MTDFSYIGKGQIYLGPVSNGVLTAGLMPIGNVSKLALTVAEESKEQLDYTSAGGGTQNKIIRIKSIDASLTLHDVSPSNLAVAIRGTATAVTAAAVTNEVQVAYRGALMPFKFMPDFAEVYSVKNTAGDVTYTKDQDYTLTRDGVIVTANSTMTNGQSVKVNYTKKASTDVEGLVNSGYEYQLVFNGLNEAQSGKPVDVVLYRVKFSPSGLDLIGDDFNKIELKGSVLQDASITGSGLSQYVKVRLVS